MRRPLKPFVTEYRGGSRRPPGQGADLFKSDAPPPSAPNWSPPAHPAHNEPAEDGYEAALRAADALFAAARPATAAPPSEPTPDGAPPRSAGPGAGRILRVLDEAPTPAMLEMERLEAEHTPKKRGRKPGSKNKPKIVALEAGPTAAAPLAPKIETPMIKAPVAEASSTPAGKVTALAARAIATAPRRTEPAAPGERYAWVRTRLKPGQQWKRRLPKVAW